MTKQRAAILSVIHSGKFHFTADEIFVEAKKIYPGISRATVYNNLRALEEEKHIRRIGGEGSSTRYDSSYIPHGHLFCTECKGIFDFQVPDFNSVLAELTGSKVDSYELRLKGVCKECQKIKI